MNNTIKKLQDAGCDIKGAMGRFLDDEEFYIECLEQTFIDPNFEELGEALKKGDVKASFECAHCLKGVVANMGLTPLYDEIVKIVEPLRAGEISGMESKYDQMMKVKKEMEELAGQ